MKVTATYNTVPIPEFTTEAKQGLRQLVLSHYIYIELPVSAQHLSSSCTNNAWLMIDAICAQEVLLMAAQQILP